MIQYEYRYEKVAFYSQTPGKERESARLTALGKEGWRITHPLYNGTYVLMERAIVVEDY